MTQTGELMLVVAEIGKKGNEHLMFNAAMTNVLKKSFKTEKTVFFGAEDHYSQLVKRIGGTGMQYIKIPVYVAHNKAEWLLKIVMEIVSLVRVCFYAKRYKARMLFFYSMLPTSLWGLNLLCRILNPDIRIIITLHGELELIGRKHKKATDKFFEKCLLKAFNLKNNNRKYLVLGDSIKENLLRLLPSLAPHEILTIPHPYIFEERKIGHNKGYDNSTIEFAQIGVASLAKNSQLIFHLGEQFNEQIEKGLLRFKIVGMLKPELEPYINKFVQFTAYKEMIDRNLFEEKISRIDFALFFYDNSNYKLCSSGAIFDAISFRKPIVAIKNDYFQYIFSLFSTPPGFLCEDIEEVTSKIKYIIENYSLIYEDLISSMDEASEILSIERISKILDEELAIAYN